MNPLDIKKLFKLGRKIIFIASWVLGLKNFHRINQRGILATIFILLFNLIFNTNQSDVLCCAKTFYKDNIHPNNLKSSKFDIDIEILALID